MPHSETNPGDLPDSCGFLSQFGRSEESTEWHSPAPAGYQRGRTKFVVVIGTVVAITLATSCACTTNLCHTSAMRPIRTHCVVG